MRKHKDYLEVINKFPSAKILVIGDLVLDIYLKGRSSRLCPEAPVPVVDVTERSAALGGAANAACNLRTLGASVAYCTVIGDDPDGDEAIQLLDDLGVDTRYMIRHSQRKTISKSRIVAGSQVITRIDQGSDHSIDSETAIKLSAFITTAYSHCDAVLISDYDKGVITPGVLTALCDLHKKNYKLIGVDSKRLTFFSPLNPSFVKPNYEEVLALLDERTSSDRVAQVSQHATRLYERLGSSLIIATLDEEGAVVIENGRAIDHVRAHLNSHPQVAGAGDTYISAFVLAFMVTADVLISAEIASVSAGVAIGKSSTAFCSRAELTAFLRKGTKLLADTAELAETCEAYRAAGKKIVFTNGCFDILHSGHVSYLHQARQLGDVLIVGLNNDDSIRRIKGASRPINSLADRIDVLAGLSSVDHIIPFGGIDDDTPTGLIRIVKPDFFVKGGDYHKGNLPEASTVEACGGTIVLIDPVPDHSTTRIINRIDSLRLAIHTLSDTSK